MTTPPRSLAEQAIADARHRRTIHAGGIPASTIQRVRRHLWARMTTPTTPLGPDDLSAPLFEQISETDHRCTRCGATNTCESHSFPSFGGTTDWWQRCTVCGAMVSGCDLSAVR